MLSNTVYYSLLYLIVISYLVQSMPPFVGQPWREDKSADVGGALQPPGGTMGRFSPHYDLSPPLALGFSLF